MRSLSVGFQCAHVVGGLVVCELVVGGSLWVSLTSVWGALLLVFAWRHARLCMASPQRLAERLMQHTIPWEHGLIHHHRAVVVVDGI